MDELPTPAVNKGGEQGVIPVPAGLRVLRQQPREEGGVPGGRRAARPPAGKGGEVCGVDGPGCISHLMHRLQVERGIDLVYGGGSVGLMGLVSRAVHNGGGHVLGIVPKSVLPRELIGDTPGETKAVAGMHQRKAEMARRSDAFIALPGGYGTLEELLEVMAWAQLGIHTKPVGLLNVDGYYDSLLSFIDKAVDEGFVTPAARHIIVAAHTPHDLLARLEDYVVSDATMAAAGAHRRRLLLINQQQQTHDMSSSSFSR
ncbi:hypothetical protein U9M48_011242 [Paspalum notatum var. saurae]|uniref:Cytokinin riboside 5'-monophosphate phosphoribohydrolase n=1 Tax=Paspalum notatum var. saurae TaxID=547442 RepID=A0AAQ3WHC8_PASNO